MIASIFALVATSPRGDAVASGGLDVRALAVGRAALAFTAVGAVRVWPTSAPSHAGNDETRSTRATQR